MTLPPIPPPFRNGPPDRPRELESRSQPSFFCNVLYRRPFQARPALRVRSREGAALRQRLRDASSTSVSRRTPSLAGKAPSPASGSHRGGNHHIREFIPSLNTGPQALHGASVPCGATFGCNHSGRCPIPVQPLHFPSGCLISSCSKIPTSFQPR